MQQLDSQVLYVKEERTGNSKMTAAMAFIVSFYIHHKSLPASGQEMTGDTVPNIIQTFWLTRPPQVQHQEDAE